MKVMPTLTVMRFGQLDPGDLFIALLGAGASYVALVAEDPAQNGQKLFVPLGPGFPGNIAGPTLITPPGMTVISFRKNYVLRLPTHAGGWSTSPPAVALLVTDAGLYFRADAGATPGQLYGYVEVATGRINTSGQGVFQQYAPPAGTPAFALEWEIVTDEPDPRLIFAAAPVFWTVV